MARDCRAAVTTLRVDGGASANNLLMQFQADLLGVPVRAPARDRDHRARRGLWPASASTLEVARDLDRGRRSGRVFEPRHGRVWREAEYGRWRRAVAALLSVR